MHSMMRHTTRRLGRPSLLGRAVGLALLVGAALPAGAQERQRDESFRWSGRATDGQWIFIRNLNGGVRVEQGSGDRIEVRAIKTWRRGDPAMVQIETRPYGEGGRNVVVCALWGDDSVCSEREYRNRSRDRGSRNNDVGVEFIVSVPRGVNVRAETVNGNVDVRGATEEVRANSVNGNVTASSTGGPVSAQAVNGNVYARMARMRLDNDMTYSTVNGNVVVEFSGEIDAELEMSTVNGGFETNFPLTLRGRLNPRHIRTTLGRGGPGLKLTTVNGNVELRKN